MDQSLLATEVRLTSTVEQYCINIKLEPMLLFLLLLLLLAAAASASSTVAAVTATTITDD